MKIFRTIGFLFVVTSAFSGGYVYRAIKTTVNAGHDRPQRKILYWVDPMHPQYKSDKPGIAPDCGMKLEPVYADDDAPGTDNTASALPPMPAGTVQVTPEKQQLIGVQYGRVEVTEGSRTIRAAGKVAIDETRIQHVHTKLEGWIDKVFVDFTGKFVKQGDPLLTIYSPEMLASQRELLLAAKAKHIMQHNPLSAAYDQSEAMVEAARRRLELWDLSPAQID